MPRTPYVLRTAPDVDTDVLVVGAGPGGLATAVTALRHGARVLVVERRGETSTVPRATGISVRTMELFRAWKIAPAVRAVGVDCEPSFAVRHTLQDPPMLEIPVGYPDWRDGLHLSPETPILCPQDLVEPLLVDQVRVLGGRVRFHAPLSELRHETDGTVTAVAGGDRIRARFVVGADGPRSAVRAALGIGVERLGTLGDHVLVVFRPDLPLSPGRPPHPLNVIQHPDAAGLLLPAGAGRWIYSCPWPAGSREHPASRPPEEWGQLIRTATGLPDLQPELLAVTPFTMVAEVASAVRSGSGFLVGDAAHRMTPVGGRGMNTAVHDGHELGWRLAWAVRGVGGEGLLDSYAVERLPVGRRNAERSLRQGEQDPHDGVGHDLGVVYRSATIVDDGVPPADGRHRTGRPGERAPHVWMRRHGRRSSVLDLFENRLTLLVTGDGAAWSRASADVVAGSRTPLPEIQVLTDRELTGSRGGIARAYRLDAGSAVLVRPDGVIAWRHDGPCDDRSAVLAAALDRVLGRAASGSGLDAALAPLASAV
jgi:2-polyprenyl-6-methoxyphenol hydroxylase-like FAD-dependent oxidoreductase